MIGLDTNVVVRYLAQDDPRQSVQATQLIESLGDVDTGFVSIVTLVETVWVLVHVYAMERNQIVVVLEKLLSVGALTVQMHELVAGALRRFAESSADFADHLIAELSQAAGCHQVATFDKIAARDAGMHLVSR